MFLRWFSASSQSWRRPSQDRFQATFMDSAHCLHHRWRPGPLIEVVGIETCVEWEADNSTNFLLCLLKPIRLWWGPDWLWWEITLPFYVECFPRPRYPTVALTRSIFELAELHNQIHFLILW